jgi:hypothetical protein
MDNNYMARVCELCGFMYGAGTPCDKCHNHDHFVRSVCPGSGKDLYCASCFGTGASCDGCARQDSTKGTAFIYGKLTEPAPEADDQTTYLRASKPNGDQHPEGEDPGATKHDVGKTKWYLLPWKVIEGVAKVMTFGANKYSENGWKSVPQAEDRYFAAMMRHWREIQQGNHIDDESGLPHWAHFCCNAVFLGMFYDKKIDK